MHPIIMDEVFTYEIREAEKLCIVVGKGAISFNSSIDAMRTLVNTPGFSPDYNIVVDLRDISYQPTYKELLGIKNHLIYMKAHFQKKIALVTTGFRMVLTELVSRLSGMNGMNVSAFSDINEAMRWISEEP